MNENILKLLLVTPKQSLVTNVLERNLAFGEIQGQERAGLSQKVVLNETRCVAK